MPISDRAFRALARAQPDVIVGLLRAITPTLLPPHAVPVPDDVAPTHLDGLPPEIDADFAARMTSEELLHMECQGLSGLPGQRVLRAGALVSRGLRPALPEQAPGARRGAVAVPLPSITGTQRAYFGVPVAIR